MLFRFLLYSFLFYLIYQNFINRKPINPPKDNSKYNQPKSTNKGTRKNIEYTDYEEVD